MNATALLVMDVQQGILERFGDDPGYLQRVSDAAAAARAAAIPVVYVTIGFRPGHPEISPQNQTFAAIGERGGFVAGDPATEIHPAVAPQPGDVVVTKRRVSAFTGSDLEVHRVLTEKVFPRQATVTTAAQWTSLNLIA
jgi:nicotinamidase-related amidase